MTLKELEAIAKEYGIEVDDGVANTYYAWVERKPYWHIRLVWNDKKTAYDKLYQIIKTFIDGDKQ